MSTETALWVIGALLIPAISWAIFMSLTSLKILRGSDDLVERHKDPAKFGLGPGNYADVVKENTRAMRALTHYLKWYIKEQVKSDPPPPLGTGAVDSFDEDGE